MLSQAVTLQDIYKEREKGMLCNFPDGKPRHSASTSWFGEEDEPFKDVLRGCEEFFALFSVKVESTLGKQRCSDGLYSSSPMMTKELKNCRGLREHGFNIYIVPMSRLTSGARIWY